MCKEECVRLSSLKTMVSWLSIAQFLWNEMQAFSTSLFCQSRTDLWLKGAKLHIPEPAWAPDFKCSRAGISRPEVLVWLVKRERKPSVKTGGTSGFGLYPRIPQPSIITFWIWVGWEEKSFLCTLESCAQPHTWYTQVPLRFDPSGFRRLPFSSWKWDKEPWWVFSHGQGLAEGTECHWKITTAHAKDLYHSHRSLFLTKPLRASDVRWPFQAAGHPSCCIGLPWQAARPVGPFLAFLPQQGRETSTDPPSPQPSPPWPLLPASPNPGNPWGAEPKELSSSWEMAVPWGSASSSDF